MKFHRITVDSKQMGGVPASVVFASLATVVGMVADGMTAQDIIAAYPDLERDDIQEGVALCGCCRARARIALDGSVKLWWTTRSRRWLRMDRMLCISASMACSEQKTRLSLPGPARRGRPLSQRILTLLHCWR
jgi:uncharacterized protein (DUF433 family)